MAITDLLIPDPGVGFPPFTEEEALVTMQIALPAKEKAWVLASDTKVLQKEKVSRRTKQAVPYGVIHHSKVSISKRHEIAVAVSGGAMPGHDPEVELATFLSEQNSIQDDFGIVLKQWGDDYYQRRCPGEHREFPLCTFLLVNPADKYTPCWKLRVLESSTTDRSSKYMVNGNEDNTAIFWPQYLKCDKETYDLYTAGRIAAFTILMGAEINEPFVGGVELWQYDHGWHRLPEADTEQLKARFHQLEDSIRKAVLK